MRIGHGYDAHRLVDGRKCVLCGVEIPSDIGPYGHSDADVATHALMDALLGAMALGDIGKFFPDTDEKYRGISSLLLLSRVAELMHEKGFSFQNADITIVTQRPKLAPYIDEMRKTLAEVIGTGTENINVKATTEEGMGFTGTGEGIAAYSVVLIN